MIHLSLFTNRSAVTVAALRRCVRFVCSRRSCNRIAYDYSEWTEFVDNLLGYCTHMLTHVCVCVCVRCVFIRMHIIWNLNISDWLRTWIHHESNGVAKFVAVVDITAFDRIGRSCVCAFFFYFPSSHSFVWFVVAAAWNISFAPLPLAFILFATVGLALPRPINWMTQKNVVNNTMFSLSPETKQKICKTDEIFVCALLMLCCAAEVRTFVCIVVLFVIFRPTGDPDQNW